MHDETAVLEAELRYHEKLYSGFAQSHFARPAVRALRRHMAGRIARLTGIDSASRVLSLGCGIGDTELLLAPHVAEITGVDLSPSAVRQACADAERMGIANAHFIEGTSSAARGRFDAVVAIFFLHHLTDRALAELPSQIAGLLKPSGVFYSLDPSVRRLSGAIGRRFIPKLMKKYQTENERELAPEATADLFRRSGFDARCEMYDLGSSPLAGLLPGWRVGYQMARWADDWLLQAAPLRALGSNFEIIARRFDERQ
jgi:2-polyprenyl-3-methyl-5-hydroxy-6-metoxy-1,4-benzoquinol methylase